MIAAEQLIGSVKRGRPGEGGGFMGLNRPCANPSLGNITQMTRHASDAAFMDVEISRMSLVDKWQSQTWLPWQGISLPLTLLLLAEIKVPRNLPRYIFLLWKFLFSLQIIFYGTKDISSELKKGYILILNVDRTLSSHKKLFDVLLNLDSVAREWFIKSLLTSIKNMKNIWPKTYIERRLCQVRLVWDETDPNSSTAGFVCLCVPPTTAEPPKHAQLPPQPNSICDNLILKMWFGQVENWSNSHRS